MNSRLPRLVWLWRITLVFYVTVMFVGTHVPVVVANRLAPSNDKALHLAAYFGLGLLTSLQLSRTWRTSLMTLVAITGWAAFDEISQPLVGRSAELVDWICDVLGASAGVGATIFGQLYRRTK